MLLELTLSPLWEWFDQLIGFSLEDVLLIYETAEPIARIKYAACCALVLMIVFFVFRILFLLFKGKR